MSNYCNAAMSCRHQDLGQFLERSLNEPMWQVWKRGSCMGWCCYLCKIWEGWEQQWLTLDYEQVKPLVSSHPHGWDSFYLTVNVYNVNTWIDWPKSVHSTGGKKGLLQQTTSDSIVGGLDKVRWMGSIVRGIGSDSPSWLNLSCERLIFM